jgi:hypothetical protein
MTTIPGSAAPSAQQAASAKGFYRGKWPFVVATGGEFVGLYFWLMYFDAGSFVLATIVLWAGFLTERYVVLNWTAVFREDLAASHPASRNDYKSFQTMGRAQKLGKLAVITGTEISIWVATVLAFDHVNWVAGFAVLVVGEQLQHSWELGLIASRPIGDYIPTWKALTITLLESVGGILWIGLVRHQQPQLGGLFMLIGLSIEHVVQSKKIKVDLAAQVEQKRLEDRAGRKFKDMAEALEWARTDEAKATAAASKVAAPAATGEMGAVGA